MENIPRVRPRAYVGAVSGLERSYRAQCAAKRYGHTLASAFGMTRASKRAVIRPILRIAGAGNHGKIHEIMDA